VYTYDLFVSYRREQPGKTPLSMPWLRKVVDRLEHYLGMELGDREPRIFFDTNCVELGDHWPQRLHAAILGSKCILPIWTPPYFRSRWCLAEWKSFAAREQLL
jgi:hypothetical protein